MDRDERSETNEPENENHGENEIKTKIRSVFGDVTTNEQKRAL